MRSKKDVPVIRLRLLFAAITFSLLYYAYKRIWDIHDVLPPFVSDLCSLKYYPAIVPGTELRILPFGDSITHGVTLPPGGNAYRLYLSQHLRHSNMNFVGTQHAGSMLDNHNEGYPGFTLEMVFNLTRGRHALDAAPNIILMHISTNDLTGQFGAVPGETPAGLANMVDYFLMNAPTAVLVVAQLTGAWNTSIAETIDWFNEQVPAIVRTRQDAGHKILLTDMRKVRGKLLHDGIHPNRAGFKHMADQWFAAIQEAERRKWIVPPAIPLNRDLKPWGDLRG